ncbi:MAG TPA: NDP-sugar synthase [Herpetosiphonaceae bacterium]|nr:NDP-sugar synthase [Herpetosiphonaceae bacterium]
MQAVVLVGGKGTRLQPLTLTTPKPLVPLGNRPLVEHIVDWLSSHGVEEILLLTQYRAADFEDWLASWKGTPVTAVEEPVPLGTAGAVANVADWIRGTTAVINGDNITNLDLRAMAQAHYAAGAAATIAVDHVDDPTGRGVVLADRSGRVMRFQEKPAPGMALASTVNTGSYLIEPRALAGLEQGRPAMWETEVFPALIASGAPVFAFAAPHLWLDAGTPAGYFAAQEAVLRGAASRPAGRDEGGRWTEAHVSVDASAGCSGPLAIGYGSIVAAGASVHGPASVGRECHVLPGALVERSAIWDHCLLEPRSRIGGSILGYNCYIADGAIVEGALLGDGVIVRPGAYIPPGSRIAPGAIVEHRDAG